MRPLLDTFRAISKLSENALGFSNYLARRNKLSFQVDVKWKRPPKYPVYHPGNSGDLEAFPQSVGNAFYGPFQRSKELENADPKVRNIFSLKYQLSLKRAIHYKNELIQRVRNHPYDYRSLEVRIAILTSIMRNQARKIETAKNRKVRLPMIRKYFKNQSKRQECLEKLRELDYKKFEWLLDQLNIVYRPRIPPDEQKRTRKKTLIKLVQLKQERIKEENLAKLRETLDKQKIPFMEAKLEKLKWIKEAEEKNDFPRTVTEADIEACMKRLEEVKIEVAQNKERGYKRNIHPYTIEPYHDALLKEKEKAGELIREPETRSKSVEVE